MRDRIIDELSDDQRSCMLLDLKIEGYMYSIDHAKKTIVGPIGKTVVECLESLGCGLPLTSEREKKSMAEMLLSSLLGWPYEEVDSALVGAALSIDTTKSYNGNRLTEAIEKISNLIRGETAQWLRNWFPKMKDTVCGRLGKKNGLEKYARGLASWSKVDEIYISWCASVERKKWFLVELTEDLDIHFLQSKGYKYLRKWHDELSGE